VIVLDELERQPGFPKALLLVAFDEKPPCVAMELKFDFF
jgi:hypothetical protein